MKFYFDSSALVKRYIQEKGSDVVDKLFQEADAVIVNAICLPEIISALSRLRREKKLSSHQYAQCKRAVIEDFTAFEVCQLSIEVISRSVDVLEKSKLRAMDALHVAAAIETKASRFISGDIEQIAAAKEFGLSIESV